MVEPQEKQVILIIADLSGYTRFVTSNETTWIHSQEVVIELIEAIIHQVEIPLEVSKLEGDAVFLYAVTAEDETSWGNVKRQIGNKLVDFFDIFSARIAELSKSRICDCNFCTNISNLKLKMVVHSGKAIFYQIDRFNELSGVDVIIVHRLLKNSVKSDQYILMTEPAYNDIELPQKIEVVEGEERYDALGKIKTYTYLRI